VKVQVKGEDSYGLSAIAPEIYRDRYCCSLCHVSSVFVLFHHPYYRFVNHIRDILDVDDERPSRGNSNNSV
jgi:hypothetical protein